ncbi:hypothetical protein K1T71_011895 [Dendrolimus kikuchii]|uniref:Uncharacterized protein n=1 Tax=Dendrolimus kikuchii TaxID=765133 RepID=A0ACC1CME7_9NEOP|nr:hypothetical protein K1T71_011895 [Dendrolimus kikuchii]
MAKFQYEGVIDDISKIQFNCIEEVLENKGFTNCKVIIEQVGEAGDNYVANIKRIITTGVDGKPFKMIAKVAPTNEQARKFLNAHNLFLNEVIMYTEVLPEFRQLQVAAEVPEAEILQYAECYGCISEPPNEFILLEDLKVSNYTMLDRFEYLSEDCLKLLLKNLAIMHSLSYVLKTKKPEKFSDLTSKFFNLWANIGKIDENVAFLGVLEEQAVNLVNDDDRRTEVVKRAGMGQISKMVDKISKADLGLKHTVILQGDLWINNIMFRFDGEKLKNLTMIDYQVSRESSPVFDLLYLLYNCTDSKMRLKHFNDWVDYYHTELDKSLSNYGLKAISFLTRDKLDADLKRYGKLVFSICILVSFILSMKNKDAAKMKENMNISEGDDTNAKPITQQDHDTQQLFKLRVEGMVDTLLELGFV